MENNTSTNNNLNFLEETQKLIKEHIESEAKAPPMQYLSPDELKNKLDLSLPNHPKEKQALLHLLKEVLQLTPQVGSKRFLNQLFGGRNVPGVCAEFIAAVLNNSMYTYKVGGPQILIEKEVTKELCKLIGYSGGEGTFVPGGSLANFVAMLLARNKTNPEIKNEGVNTKTGPLIIYTSKEGHYSIPKNADLLGFGKNNVRYIETNEAGCMIPEELETQIQADKEAGSIPCFINATAGTTVLGSFDPIEKLAKIANQHNLWLHVDGALGGSVMFSQKHKHLLDGTNLADSFSINAHKMFGVPLSCSCILLKDKGNLHKAFSQKADYLFQTETDEFNPGTRSLQCGRKNDALKFWLLWQYFGTQGLAHHVDTLFDLAQYTAKKVKEQESLSLLKQPQSVNVCFTVKGISSKQLCEELDKSGLYKVGYGSVDKLSAIRIPLVNPELTKEDIDRFLEDLLKYTLKVFV